jgi:flagellin-specific chaperone FliS
MAWFSKLFIFTVLSVLLAHCQTDAFKTVNDSLNKSIAVDHFAVDELYFYIKQNRQKNEALAVQADKLYASTKEAHRFIEDLKQELELKDSSRVSTVIPAQLLGSIETSDRLSQKLSAIYDYSHAALNDKNKSRSLDSTLAAFKEIRNNKQWTTKYFDRTPTIAVITILSKFQYDCQDAARFVLGDIKQHLDN